MAITDFQIGQGNYALAYGRHLVAGTLAAVDTSVSTAVKIKVLMGLGEWDSIEELTYDGSVIASSNYTFHPGTLSTGEADPLQGKDARFPKGIYHSGIAYYTLTIPSGLTGASDRPDKMRVKAKTLKINDYDEAGSLLSYAYNTNPANVFADLVRRNSIRLGLNFADQMDWDAYMLAKEYYNIISQIETGANTPKGVTVGANVGGSGTLAAGTWYYRVSALKADGVTESAASGVKRIELAGSGNAWASLSWTAVSGADKYRVYFGFDTANLDKFFETTSITFNHTTTTGALTESPRELSSGSWIVVEPHLQSHRAFTQTDILTADALSAVMFDAASTWVRDGEKHRIILPNQTTIQHRFTPDNTTGDAFAYWKVPARDRKNRITASYRNLKDNMKPTDTTVYNDPVLQARFQPNEEIIYPGSMNPNQVDRIGKWRYADEHQLPRRLKITGQHDSAHLLVGDVVAVADRQAGTRNQHGVFSASNGIIFDSRNYVDKFGGGTIEWDGMSPTGDSRALKVILPAVDHSNRGWISAITPFEPQDGSYLTVWVKIDPLGPNAYIDEITIQLLTADYSTRLITAMRKPQSTFGESLSGGDIYQRINIPPVGEWVPIRISLDRATDKTFSFVGGSVIGKDIKVRYSEYRYTEDAGVRYRVSEIEDKDPDGPDDRTFTLQQYNESAYVMVEAAEPEPSAINVALASAGSTATASSTYNSSYPASGAINGIRHTAGNWSAAGNNWNSAGNPSDEFPEWLEVNFNATRTISLVNVFTLKDILNYSTDPSLSDTFSSQGIVNFSVQYWNGTAWADIPGGSVVGNNKIWIQFSFSPLSTTKIRVLITAALSSFARITEVEAWGVNP